jgi:hypothetical protein
MEANLVDGMMYYYLEPGTGRPIAAWEREVYYLDVPEHVAYLQTVPIGSGYTQQREMLQWTRNTIEQAQTMPTRPAMGAEAVLETLPGQREQAQSALDTQHESGVWLVDNVANFMGSVGRGFGATSPRTLLILRYVERARIAKGEIAPVYRGDGTLERAAYPGDDWYDLNWAEHIGVE